MAKGRCKIIKSEVCALSVYSIPSDVYLVVIVSRGLCCIFCLDEFIVYVHYSGTGNYSQ